MAAYELLQPFYQNSVQTRYEVIAPTTTLYRGNLVMNATGSGASVFTRAGYAAGASLLGFPRETYADNATGIAPLTRSGKICYHRGCPFEADGKSGDLPTTNDIGSLVSMYDESTVCKTPAAGDLKVVLLEVRSGGKFLVQLP